jgi:hypothetical protein
MSRPTLRILTYPGLALALLAGDAEAGVGDMSGGALSSLAYLSPAQTVQYAGDCWYDNGWNGPGYYPCGNEWNSGFGGAGAIGPIIVPASRRRHHHAAVVAHPKPNPIYSAAPSPRVGAGVRVSPNFHPRAAAVTSGLAGGGFQGALGGGNFHQFHSAGVPHISAPVSSGLTGAGGFHAGGAIGTSHIGAPASPGFAGVGTFHAGGLGAAHIGAPASPGLAGGGFHGVGGGGVFQGGGAGFGQGGIGHR